MKVKQTKVPYYKWRVITILVENYEDKPALIKKMHSLRMREEDVENISTMMDDEANGGAVCHYNLGKLISIIIVFPHKDIPTLVSTLIHEGRHAADKIIETTGIEGYESAAYLTEYVTFKLIEEYLKDEKS